ncbi:Gag protein [Phytophthora palmivora]|uniref:Gag protein n=1 Tax=Phytophthora palmivora TaxID=4796 RepID=A0A2P4XTU6_9STRA|nr:Gag protein [Phytophthora palmivora]
MVQWLTYPDLAVKVEDFDSTKSFLVLHMDKYDFILGLPWLEKRDPWIDWGGKSIELAGLQSPTEHW